MELLMEPPPEFDGVVNAFAMARQLPSTHVHQLKIGLAQEGVLFASCVLHGSRQVAFFSEHLRAHGWREHLLGGEDDMLGCDMLFSHPVVARADSDPSFIRKPVVQLWPLDAQHAKP
jgi:hypothetical protein